MVAVILNVNFIATKGKFVLQPGKTYTETPQGTQTEAHNT